MFRRKSRHEPLEVEVSLPLTPPSLPDFPSSPSHGTFSIPIPSDPNGPLRRSSSSHNPGSHNLGKARVTAPAISTSYHKPSAYVVDPNSTSSSPPRPATFARSPSYPEGIQRYAEFSPKSSASLKMTSGANGNGNSNGGGEGVGAGAGAEHHHHAHRPHDSRYSIASLYPSPATFPPPLPASALPTGIPKSASLPNVRRSQKAPPTFNVLVVGARGTGKTSLIKTLLGNVHLAAPPDALVRVARFGLVTGAQEARIARTVKPEAVSVDVVGSDKFTLTCLDTVGLDIPLGAGRVGDELEVERQMAGILRMIEARFDETLQAENQVFRHSHRAHDSHFHLCIYLLHPESIAPRPLLPTRKNSVLSSSAGSFKRSQSTPSLVEAEPTWADDGETAMSEIDLRCIKKLARRVNVLPVVGRSDEITSTKLAELKAVVRRDLAKAGLDFGTFGPSRRSASEESEDAEGEEAAAVEGDRGRGPETPGSSGSGSGSGKGKERNGTVAEEEEAEEEEAEEEEAAAAPIKLIRIRSTSRHARRGSKSRTVDVFDSEPADAWEELKDVLPFALVAPESWSGAEGEGEQKFVRVFKYGTLDVLNPDHSDFVPLRDALLGPQMRLLKESTRLEKYEPFRTQRLLARRGTRVLPEATRNTILKDLSAI